MHQLRALATALGLAVTLAGCSTAAGHGSAPRPSAGDSSQAPPLRSEVDSQFIYTLKDLHSCQVGDAMAVAINQARDPLRVTAAMLSITSGGAHNGARPRRAPATVGDHRTDRSLPASR
jgi:hypothetical protein